MSQLRNIVVGIDFTECSRNALRQAVRLAAAVEAGVRVVHVIDTVVVLDLTQAASPIQQKIQGGLEREARTAWQEFSKGINGAASLPFDVIVNNRVAGLLAAVNRGSADLLVLGAFGHRRPDVGIGTVASACVRHSPVDVLLIRDTQPTPFSRVVCGVDFSDAARRALDHAARLAAAEGAELHVLHVFDAPWNQVAISMSPDIEMPDPAAYRARLEQKLSTLAADVKAAFSGLQMTTRCFETSNHRSGINTYAAEVAADLVVVGTRGRTNLRDMLLGSTAEKTLLTSRCSVLAVVPETKR